jgi:U3 small nucleolar ribonucleoprotein protein LCP5
MRDGISLLSLKHHTMLSYLQSATLLILHRALGNSLGERSPPKASFASAERSARGSGAGDLVDHMVEGRLVLEKIKVLENRMKYQIEKLVRVATEPQSTKNVIDGKSYCEHSQPLPNRMCSDPLAFRPNPQNLLDQGLEGSDGGGTEDEQATGGIYRPPKVAPMPYTESRKKDSRQLPVPTALSGLSRLDPSQPHVESTSGLGNMPSLTSNRAREIQEMNEWEETNMTRLVMKKKDDKRRRQDEADIALGGLGAGGRRGGFEEEFGDVLRSVARSQRGVVGDGYEELRKRGKKEDAFSRSRARSRDDAFSEVDADDGPRQRKRSRFDKAVKASKSRSKR